MCNGNSVPLPASHPARLVIFFGSNFSRYVLYRGAEVLRAFVDVVKVQELGALRFKLVDAPRSVPTTQGAYHASPLRVEVSSGRCNFALQTGDSMVVGGLRVGVGVCEKRTQVEDPHAGPTVCILRAQAQEQ